MIDFHNSLHFNVFSRKKGFFPKCSHEPWLSLFVFPTLQVNTAVMAPTGNRTRQAGRRRVFNLERRIITITKQFSGTRSMCAENYVLFGVFHIRTHYRPRALISAVGCWINQVSTICQIGECCSSATGSPPHCGSQQRSGGENRQTQLLTYIPSFNAELLIFWLLVLIVSS